MRFTSEADCALRIMRCLAQTVHDGRDKLDAKSISEAIDSPQRFTVKILHKLVSGGLLCSYKGASGGYALMHPAEEISVKDIIEMIDGPLEISRCLSDCYECTRKDNGCFFHEMFKKANANLAAELDGIKLSDSLASAGTQN